MPAKITRDILEGFISCPYKGLLRSKGENGNACEYELLLSAGAASTRTATLGQLISDGEDVDCGSVISKTNLRRGKGYSIDCTFNDDSFELHFDGIMRVEGVSKLGRFHYVPLLFNAHRPRKGQKLILGVYGQILAQLQGRPPTFGLVWHGDAPSPTKIRLSFPAQDVEELLRSLRHILFNDDSPPLILNDHCAICEFQDRCREKAETENNLSLIRGIGPKEIKRFARKGIFTVSQLAHTFKPRRKGKRSAKGQARQYPLQAMAVRDKTIYVLGQLELPQKTVQLYLDIEGDSNAGAVYLIGLFGDDSGKERCISFWANDKAQEAMIIEQFLDSVAQYDDLVLYYFGSYEQTFLRRLLKQTARKPEVERLMAASVNILSSIYSHVYFPTYSNGLKEIGHLLGCRWSEPNASGIQSLVWRAQWEATHDDKWKQTLLQYNLEDCAALKVVTRRLLAIAANSDGRPGTSSEYCDGLPVTNLQEIDQLASTRKWGTVKYVHPEFSQINGCAYFNYQHQRVFVRSSRTIRKNIQSVSGYRNRRLRVTRCVHIVASRCEKCGSPDVYVTKRKRWRRTGPRKKRAFDLVATDSGIKRSVIECTSDVYRCRSCREDFIPKQYLRLAQYFHGVKSWAMYQHIAHGTSFGTIKLMLDTFFGLPILKSHLHHFKSMLAEYYKPTCEEQLKKLLKGNLLHVDETNIRLKGSRGKGYVWAFTNLEEVVYIFRPTREGDFLYDLLKDFHGVVVSDFYAAYDALDCPQQKCLIHLIRDMNDDLMGNPFDTDLQGITKTFGVLLRSIVACIDEHGLKKWYLRQFRKEVSAFFETIAAIPLRTDAAKSLKQRLLKYRPKLFTFLDHDGVPWNNNNAENAIKYFAYYRAHASGMMTVNGLNDFLTLLSICQTCRYKGISFWQFLMSRSLDLDGFAQGQQRWKGIRDLEMYPEGYVTAFQKIKNAHRDD